MTIAQALSWARDELYSHNISDDGLYDSSAIDSKVLLSVCLQREVVYLHTWPEKLLDKLNFKGFLQSHSAIFFLSLTPHNTEETARPTLRDKLLGKENTCVAAQQNLLAKKAKAASVLQISFLLQTSTPS